MLIAFTVFVFVLQFHCDDVFKWGFIHIFSQFIVIFDSYDSFHFNSVKFSAIIYFNVDSLPHSLFFHPKIPIRPMLEPFF